LKQKTEQQEAALRQLRQELAASRMAQGDVVSGFQELIQVQSEQFQELADRFSRLMTGR
jgi:energy-converting hydrogenase A subunit M